MRDNIQSGPGTAYTMPLYPRKGGPPKIFWIMDEVEGGWWVEETVGTGNPGIRRQAEFLSAEHWTKDEPSPSPDGWIKLYPSD
jgi:hypothetical protein